MSEYDDIFAEDETTPGAAPRPIASSSEAATPYAKSKTPAPPPPCPRWMYHRPGVFCHVCEQVGGKTVKGVSLHLDLPPGGKAKSDWKKGKRGKE